MKLLKKPFKKVFFLCKYLKFRWSVRIQSPLHNRVFLTMFFSKIYRICSRILLPVKTLFDRDQTTHRPSKLQPQILKKLQFWASSSLVKKNIGTLWETKKLGRIRTQKNWTQILTRRQREGILISANLRGKVKQVVKTTKGK